MLGPCDPIVYKAYECLDKLGRVTKLLAGFDGGSSERTNFLAIAAAPQIRGRYLASNGGGRHQNFVDANDFGWGGHTMQGVVEYAHEYFSEAESYESST